MLGLGLSLWNAALGRRSEDYIGVIAYGQSNDLNMFSLAASPPAALPDTYCWDNTNGGWIAPPNANGVREFANALATLSGKPVRIVYAGASGVTITALMEGHGDGHFDTLRSRILASGIVAHYVLYNQGEGEADAPAQQATWIANLGTLHQSIVSVMGRTKAQCPLVIAGIGRRTSGDGSLDAGWSSMRSLQMQAATSLSHVHYSHSNVTAPMLDDYHWSAAGQGVNGQLAARTLAWLRGDAATRPLWQASAAERVDATHTDVTLTHAMGSDFTPASGVTGFEVSNDNGASWQAAAGARLDAATIRLTHADLGTVQRNVRYLWGRDPDVSAPVRDDGALTAPLNFTQAELIAEGAAALPAPAFVSSGACAGSGVSQTRNGVALGTRIEDELFIVAITIGCGSPAPALSTLVLSRAGESDVAFAKHTERAGSGDGGTSIWSAPVSSAGASGDFALTFAANPFGAARLHLYRVPVSHLNSTTPVDADSLRTPATLTGALDLDTAADGFIVTAAVSRQAVGNSGDLAGSDETFTRRDNASAAGGQHVVGDASGVAAASGDNAVVVAYAQSSSVNHSAASWR